MNKVYTTSRILELISIDLNLSIEEYKRISRIYSHLGNWIKQDSLKRFKADSTIYAHGSLALGAITKTFDKDKKYDLDLIYCRHLSSISQLELMDQIEAQLQDYIKDNSRPQEPMEIYRWPQCITIYIGDDFSIDVVPAIPDCESIKKYIFKQDKGISTVDSTLYPWQYSNPKGYAEWFSTKDNQQIEAEKRSAFLANKAADVDVERLPLQECMIETPLKKANQILKRHRDIHFQKNKDLKPSSIIITTLATKAYGQEDDLIEALKSISSNMVKGIDHNKNGEKVVYDPTFFRFGKFEPGNFAKEWLENPEFEESFHN